MIGMSRRFMREWHRSQAEDESVRVIGMFVNGRPVTVTHTENRDVNLKELEAGKRWFEGVCAVGENNKECIVCQEEEMTLRCENPVMDFVTKLGETCEDRKGVPLDVKTCVSMNCCHQSIHIGCVLSWWIGKVVWTCPYCRVIHSGKKESGVVTQIVDAVTRTVWDVEARPDPAQQIVIPDDDEEEEEEDRYDLDSVDEDTLDALETFLMSFSH